MPGMVFDNMVTKLKHALPHSDTCKIRYEQYSVKNEESQADSWGWGEKPVESPAV